MRAARLLLIALVPIGVPWIQGAGLAASPADSLVATRIAKLAAGLDQGLAPSNGSKPLTRQRNEWLRQQVAELEELLAKHPTELDPIATELLDLAGFGLTRSPKPADFQAGDGMAQIRAHGARALERIREEREDEFVDWIARGVLAEARRHPVERRWVALYLLRGTRSEVVAQALLCVARDASDPLRAAVLREMPACGWDGVDRYLVELFDLPRDPLRDPHPFDLLRTRLERGPLGCDAEALLARRTKTWLLSSDWRDASRALALLEGLDPMRAAPVLIETLHVWKARQGDQGGARRVVHEIVRALQTVSGKTMGANPRHWTTWWQAVCEGSAPLHTGEVAHSRAQPVSTFFGLEPYSDRVTFIIDHSGSMRDTWGATDRSRWVEAIHQLANYLHASGEDTRFDIVLFDTLPHASTKHLVAATPDAVEGVRKSLVRLRPDGGTNLKLAVEYALRVDSEGHVDPARVEADTIVVLCDGATAEGPGWVAPFIEKIDADLRVIFHSVLIGPNDDGTLEALARATGGEFLRVDG